MSREQTMASDSTRTNFTRRAAFGGLLLPAAGLLLGGCASGLKKAAAANNGQPEIPERRGGYAMRADGTRVFRDHMLVDQDGKKVRFQSDLVEGQVFGATFQYANCKGICSNMTEQMKKSYDLMRPIMGNPVQFYMFSLAQDTPADMKKFMQARGVYGLPGWRFFSGSKEAITDIRWAFGFGDPNEELDQSLEGHTGMVRFCNHRLDKWAACPAQGSPEATARLLVRLLPSNERPNLAGIEYKVGTPGLPMKNWTPARAVVTGNF
jgi:protein SCO1/2